MRIFKLTSRDLTTREGMARKWKISRDSQSGERGGRTAESSNSLYLTFIFYDKYLCGKKMKEYFRRRNIFCKNRLQ